MGCKISTAVVSARSVDDSGEHHATQQSVGPKIAWSIPNEQGFLHGSPPSRQSASFIHDMLRPQLDPAIPPIGFGMGRKRAESTPNDDYMETASVELCFARVISLRDGIIQASQQQQELANAQQNNPQQPSPQPSISSANSDLTTLVGANDAPRQLICGTAVSFEWLFQRLVEKFKCPTEPEPQWIVEKLNDIGDKDLDRTIVLRITFGWENPKLPKSVVLKISETHEDDPPEEAKLGSALFRRECQTYEWLSKQRRVAIPRVFVIKKQWSKSCNALLVMEDLSERAQTGEINDGIPLDGVRDLLRNLAQLHAHSMVQTSTWREALGGAELPAFLFVQTEKFARSVLKNGIEKLDVEKLKLLDSIMQRSNLERTITKSCAEMDLPECLLHGHPIGRNVFLRTEEGKGLTVIALIDWTQAHCGCIGEDLAKCICWNLEKKDRAEPTLLRLLQYYHYQLLKKLQFYGVKSDLQKRLTLDKITDAYERFVPLAAVTFLLFLPQDLNRADSVVLERAQKLVDEAVEMLTNEKEAAKEKMKRMEEEEDDENA